MENPHVGHENRNMGRNEMAKLQITCKRYVAVSDLKSSYMYTVRYEAPPLHKSHHPTEAPSVAAARRNSTISILLSSFGKKKATAVGNRK